jgi:hypothetical protein
MNKKFFLPLMTFVVLTAVVVIWHQFFYEATRREILTMQLETRRLRGLEREISKLKARHDLTALLSTKENQLNEARIFLPTTPAQDKFIDELYRTAEFYRVRLISVQSGEITSAAEIQSQVVNVSLEADYVSLLNFIRETIDGGRMVDLENFSVMSSGDNVLSCELSFKIFAAPSSN